MLVFPPLSLEEKLLWKGNTCAWPGRAKSVNWLAALSYLSGVVPEFQCHHSQFLTRSPALLCAGEVQGRKAVPYLQVII